MVVEQVTSQPYRMEEGSVTAVKLTISWEGDNPAPSKEEIIEINPVPFSELERIAGSLSEYFVAKTEFEELKERYEPLKEKCERTYQEVEAIIKKPSIEEIPQAEKKDEPPQEEKDDKSELVDLAPRQAAEHIYENVFKEIKGKSVKDQDIRKAVLNAGVHPDKLEEVFKEVIVLLKEKGAINTTGAKLKRLLGGGKKKETKK